MEYNNVNLINDDSAQNIVKVTLDLANTSLRAGNINVYVAVYKEEGTLYSANVEKRILQSEEKQQLVISVKVPNDGKNIYDMIFVWDDGMQSATCPTPFIVVNEKTEVLSYIVFNEDTILYTDMYYNNISITGGTIDLLGHKLYKW